MTIAFGLMFGAALMFWSTIWLLLKWVVDKIHSKFER